MNKYKVYYEGFYVVEAESREQAEEALDTGDWEYAEENITDVEEVER